MKKLSEALHQKMKENAESIGYHILNSGVTSKRPKYAQEDTVIFELLCEAGDDTEDKIYPVTRMIFMIYFNTIDEETLKVRLSLLRFGDFVKVHPGDGVLFSIGKRGAISQSDVDRFVDEIFDEYKDIFVSGLEE